LRPAPGRDQPPAWTERGRPPAGGGRPPAGYVAKRLAGAWLRDVLDEARRGSLPGMVRTGATFADAGAEYPRYVPTSARVSRRRCAPQSGEVRSVPMAPTSPPPSRHRADEHDGSVMATSSSSGCGGYLDGSALRRRYAATCGGSTSGRCASTICATRSQRA
jgi:hypothetical protein